MLNSLLKALNSSNSVTLPNFGGFMKMGSSFMFNEFLKFNDGKFAKFLQENENLSEQEANSKIENFITEIKEGLDSKGSFPLNGIGTLKLIDGKIKLEKPIPDSTKKVETPAPKKSEPKPIDTSAEEEKNQVKETKKKEIAKDEKEEPIVKEEPKVKEQKKIVVSLSVDFTVKEAQGKIKSLKDKQEIIDFTKGDKRKTIVEALNQRLKSLNKIDATELDILEAAAPKKENKSTTKDTPIKEGSEKEVKKQVAKESDILETVVKKEIADNPAQEKGKEKEKEKENKPPVKKVIINPPVKKEEIVKVETEKKTSEEEDLVALTEGAVKLEKEAKGRKRNKIIFWIALICILSGGGIVGYLKQDIIFGWFENTEELANHDTSDQGSDSNTDNEDQIEKEDVLTEVEDAQIIEEETTIEEEFENDNQPLNMEEEEEIIVEETIIEPEEEIRVESANKGNYYVVVGSFSKEKNALNLVKSLKEEGFSGAKVFQNGNLQSVSLGEFSNSKEAKEALKQSGKDGWVKKPR